MLRIILIFTICLIEVKAYTQINEREISINTRPVLTDAYEKLDIEKYRKLGEASEYYISIKGVKSTTNYWSYNSNQIDRKHKIGGFPEKGYYSIEKYTGSYFDIKKNYYPNGNIKRKRLTLNRRDNAIGREFNFDENGELSSIIDNDFNYKYSIEQVMQQMHKVENLEFENGIKFDTYSSKRASTLIYQCNIDGKYVWRIEWKERGETTQSLNYKIITVTLDGNTGKFISKKETEHEIIQLQCAHIDIVHYLDKEEIDYIKKRCNR